MKCLILVIGSLLFLSNSINAQNSIDNILLEVSENNTSLIALRSSIDANKIENKIGNTLHNPEVEFNYLWGNPSNIGNRKDFSVSQTFDFPSAYFIKSDISELKNEQVELEYKKQLSNIRLQAELLCIDLIYYNSLISELRKRYSNAENIANAYQTKFEKGEANILENNKSKLNLLNLENEISLNEIEKQSILSELTKLNGGKEVVLEDTSFPKYEMIDDFQVWFELAEQSNPSLTWLKYELEISQKNVKLSKALSLPKFQVGYMSETVVGQDFKGVSFGVSIPLWENKYRTQHSKQKTIALESVDADAKFQFYSEMKSIHTKAINLNEMLNEYRLSLDYLDTSDLLLIAHENGEISLINYFLELSIYYQGIDQLFEIERNLHRTLAILHKYEMS